MTNILNWIKIGLYNGLQTERYQPNNIHILSIMDPQSIFSNEKLNLFLRHYKTIVYVDKLNVYRMIVFTLNCSHYNHEECTDISRGSPTGRTTFATPQNSRFHCSVSVPVRFYHIFETSFKNRSIEKAKRK